MESETSLTLFRITVGAPLRPPMPQCLPAGLRRHLLDAGLNSHLVQVDDRQQAYVELAPCPGCHDACCRPDCQVELLRRLLALALGSAISLRPVRAFSPRPYRRAVLMRPTSHAAPLDAVLLAAWPEARLSLAWRPMQQQAFPLTVFLQLGATGPDPLAVLAAWGWQAGMVDPDTTIRQQQPVFWCADPFLMLPIAPPIHRLVPAEHAVLQERQEALAAILNGEFAPVAAAGPAATVPGPCDDWPSGPGNGGNAMTAADIEALVTTLLAVAELGGTAAGAGLKRRRLLPLLAERHKEHAAALCCWFELAGLLAAPADPVAPWSQARPLLVHDRAVVASRLRSTALPDQAALAAARAGGL